MAHSKSLQPGEGWRWEIPSDCPAELQYIVSALNQSRHYISRCVDGLSREMLWKRINANMPSMGNILMHLKGTEHHWIGHYVGGNALQRNRPLEFSTENGEEASVLLGDLKETAEESHRALAGLNVVDDRVRFCLHYVENHFAFHAGQLCTIRKVHDSDFQLYPEG